MSTYQPITKADGWHCGEDATIVFVVRDGDGLPETLTGKDLSWSAYRAGVAAGATAVVGPITSDDGISVVTVSLSSVEHRLARMGVDLTGWPSTFEVAKVAVTGVETEDVTPGLYEHELWRTNAPATLLAHGPAELLPSVRR